MRKRSFRSAFVKVPGFRKGRKKRFGSFFVVMSILLLIAIPFWIFSWWFYSNIWLKIPDISNIEKVVFSQTTNITDRNGKVLYKVFEENREYVRYENISTNMINAIIAVEDKNFWTNPWIDISWIFRALVYDITHPWEKQWWSTLTQQLIKNLLLTRDRTIERKLKELVLSLRLNDYLLSKVKDNYKDLSDAKLNRKIKENILEMYLNYVFFWNNLYWIEAAAKWYFGKHAYELTFLESAVLASIPKSPTRYNPHKNYDIVMWKLVIYDKNNDIAILSGDLLSGVYNTYSSYLNDIAFTLLNSEKQILTKLNPINLQYKWYKITYNIWRKDMVLARLLEDWYVSKTQFIKAMIDWFLVKYKNIQINIKAPHFVFYVLSILEERYGADIISKAWWTVKTSLDMEIQDIAEDSVELFSWYLADKWAQNSALLYLDSEKWDVIAYVWSSDYYNKEIDWKVDIINAKRQPWSTVKPFMYASALLNHPYTLDTPVYDVEFPIAADWDTFNNFDGEFMWVLPLRKALGHSRNIPAAKMYFLWWGEEKVKAFLRSIWLTTISNNIFYGYPLSIWSAEVRMIDLAKAFSHLSRLWEPVDIDPILEIRWPDGDIIYQKVQKKKNKIIPSGVAYMLWSILSDAKNRPSWWNNLMNVPWLNIATKSWTTNVKLKNWKKLPRDGWFVWYTPTKVFVSWAGNTKWEPMKPNAYGWWTAGKVWRKFVDELKARWHIAEEEMQWNWTMSLQINKLSWLPATFKTPTVFVQNTIALLSNIPNWKDTIIEKITIDKLCDWKVSKYTPESEKVEAYLIKPKSLKPTDIRWEEWMMKWWQTKWINEFKTKTWKTIILNNPKKECEQRKIVAEKWLLKYKIIKPSNTKNVARKFDIRLQLANKPFDIKSIDISIDWANYITITKWKDILRVNLIETIPNWKHNISISVKDVWWYKIEKSIEVNVQATDTTKPYNLTVEKSSNWNYLYIFMDDISRIKWWKITCWGITRRFNWPIATGKSNDCGYEVEDLYGNTLIKK